ncbi:enoyl-[acyl-carrier-protein] reductase FabK [Candidatus Formimonas warabiya]|uniref:Probable nitronate monooxygenase n=1 Tax=Formimonas warabiya TaxID=1761012 RepID=A0A3G1KQD7_FORW1|nr:enoyl-[acyl-carrier-protein] reductase FabK [Candidatus Formimonas warabiya]ATW24658.1 2-nitropropane dioxygenase [Candidatus Formimonas warabiya]
MLLDTGICPLLNIKYPIIQGGMAWVATGELAAAVSEAGGLGIIAAGNAPPEILRREIHKARATTDCPFGVNVYYLSPYLEEAIKVVIEEKVPVVTTGAGNPGKHLPALKEIGTKVIPVVSSPVLAKRLERAGADAFIAEGMECGGHVGDITTLALVPQVVDAVSVPVIAAGGIYDGRGLVAALALGASGVQIGTRFICAAECTAHENYKQAVIKAKERDTILTGYEGHFVRVIKNKLTREYDKLIKENSSLEELDNLGIGRLRAAVVDGDVEMGSVMAGQVAAMVHKIQPAREIIEEIMSQAQEVLGRLKKL